MQGLLVKLSLVASAAVGALANAPEDVQIAVTLPVECDRKTVNGDDIQVHYRGTLQASGQQFDASYDRNQPLSFTLGSGRVIKGWEEGLLDMCIGEKRTLTIPPHKAYGKRSIGPIPADSTLIFETELVAVKGVPKPESIKTKSTEAPAAASSETASASGVAGKIAEKVGDAAKVAETVLADTDSDGQEHNEL